MKRIITLFLLILLKYHISDGQGTIRGKVTDENGSGLIGATIMLKTPSPTGTVTDFDGNYSLKVGSLSPQILVLTYIGYETIHDTINARNGEVLVINYDLVPAASVLAEVTVTARAVKARESFMEKVKIKSVASLDFISAATIKRTGDANVSAAVSRITGVSTFGGFITVRGIGDRYIKTSINGLRIPTLDPFTNNIKLDLFPAFLVDNIVITKTASTDLPGDWSGAYLSIETKDFPEKLSISFETSVGFNSQSTFKDAISTERSPADWLGFDNGLRTVVHEKPANYGYTVSPYYQEFAAAGLKEYFDGIGVTENTEWFSNDFTNIYTRLALTELGFLGKAQFNDYEAFRIALSEYDQSEFKLEGLRAATEEVVKMGQSLPNNWLTINRKAPVDFSQSLSIGSQTNILNKPLGYLFGFRYSSSMVYDDNGFYGRTEQADRGIENIESSQDFYKTISNVKYGTLHSSIQTNGWSALAQAALKLNTNNSISFLFMPNMIGTNMARFVNSFSDRSGSPSRYNTYSMFYESRSQMVYQLKTDHYLPASKAKIEINASYTNGKSNLPDFKQSHYYDEQGDDVSSMLTGESQEDSNFRLYRTLTEELFDSHISAEIPLAGKAGLPRKIKFGAAWQRLIRRSDQHYYWLPPPATASLISNNDIAGYFNLDSFALDGYKIKRYYWQLAGSRNNTIGFSNDLAGFIMTDFTVVPALRIAAGIRVEDVHLHTDIADFYERQLPVNDYRRVAETGDEPKPIINPGFLDNLFWLPNASMIFQLKRNENAPANLRLNYSRSMALPSLRELTPFEVYDYTLLGVVTGNSVLEPVKIDNYDIRSETYFISGNSISISLFYKNFENHIEMVREVRDEVYYSWQNAEKSTVAGIEMEGRVGITERLEFRANATYVDSRTRLEGDVNVRDMYGQAPYVINAMLTYTPMKTGFTASCSYNVQGPKLVISGNYESPDIYELPRNIIDLKFTKTIGKHFTASFRIRDLLNTSVTRAYNYSAGWLDFDTYRYGSSYLFGINYNFN